MKKLFIILCVAAASVPVLRAQELADSLIAFPWEGQKTYCTTTGSALTVSTADLEKRALGDLRNRFTGLVPGFEVTESGGSFLSTSTAAYCNYNFGTGGYNVANKGFTTLKFIVDDVTIPFNQLLLDPNQIESVTILTDILDKVKYGPMASYGAVYVKTKKGGYNTPLRFDFDFEAGANMVDKVPEWVSGAEYATLNNMARTASGYTPLYSDEAVAEYRKYKANDLLYPCVDYRSLMLKNAFDSERFGFSATAGSNTIKYSVALNALHSGDIKADGPTQDYNKLNVSANVTTKIGQWVEASAGFIGLLAYRELGQTNWYDWYNVPEIAFPLSLGNVQSGDLEGAEGRTIYGVSKTWGTNYYAKMLEGGFRQVRNRSGLFTANVNVDLGFLVKGLKSKTMAAASTFLSTTIGKSNDYIAYYWDPTLGGQEISDHKGEVSPHRSTSSTTTSQTLSMYERLYYNWEGAGHKIDAGATYYMYNAVQTGDSERQRQQYFTLDGGWSYRDRYSAEIALEYAGSSRYKGAARWGFFPSVGLAWTVSNEEWMKGARAIDNLKLHAQAGKGAAADVFGTGWLYQGNYNLTSGMTYGPTTISGAQWFGNLTRTSKYTSLTRNPNEALTWPWIKQVDFGVDLDLLECLHIGASGYYWKSGGQIGDVNSVLPSVFGLANISVYDNYEEEDTGGWDVNVCYHRNFGDFGLKIGADLYSWKRINSKLISDEYSEEYQKKTGTSTTSIWGLQCLGKYKSEEQIQSEPSYAAKTAIQVGDLMYKDMNGDGNIDTNDRIIIGDSNPKLRYSLNLGLTWKNFDFQVVGTGRFGGNVSFTNEYFWQGWGDGNYSAFVRDNIGGAYPNLTYTKSTNNFVASSFWLREASWFKVQNVELGYNLNFREKTKGLRGMRFSVKGENLLTLTNLEYVDPEATGAGVSSYPLFRLVTGGVKFNF